MSLFSSGKPQPLGSLVKAQFEAGRRFLTGSPSIQDLRNLGYTQYCGSTSDCGYGSQCVDGLCRPIGNGNTRYGEDGCSSGSSTPPATLDCITCGYDGEKSCAGTRSCTFTPYGVTCRCGQSSNNGDDGNGGEEGKPCNKYCTTEYASYGSYSGGCSDRNTCSECYSCEGGDADNGNCTKKSRDDGAPCHCDPRPDESCEPRDETPLTCCSYRDTCAGRVEGPYCHETYRTFYPRCYDPDYPDCSGPRPTDEGCLECTYGTVSWNPNQSEPVLDEEGAPPCSEGCAENEVQCTDPVSGNCFCRECCPNYGGNNELINEDTGDRVTFIECCKNKCPGVPGCSSSMDCGVGKCCENGKCVDCSGVLSCTQISPLDRTFNGDTPGYVKRDFCACTKVTVLLHGDGRSLRYQNDCNTPSTIFNFRTSLYINALSPTLTFANNAVAFELGYSTNINECPGTGDGTCLNYVSGVASASAPCGSLPANTKLYRNVVLKVTFLDLNTGELYYKYYGLINGDLITAIYEDNEFYLTGDLLIDHDVDSCSPQPVNARSWY